MKSSIRFFPTQSKSHALAAEPEREDFETVEDTLSSQECIHLQAPDSLTGEIELPASKSISNRALLLNALNGNRVCLTGLAYCEDTLLMQRALQSEQSRKELGAAGTAMRFLTAYYALQKGEWLLNGNRRMKERPIRLLVNALRKWGANIEYTENEGFPPLRIQGHPLKGGQLEIDGSVSSQYLSALAMSAPATADGLRLQIQHKMVSFPYLQMSLRMMQDFGADIHIEKNQILIAPGYKPRLESYCIEADWSAASYWYEMLALADKGELVLKGLKADSIQGDRRCAEYFEAFGVSGRFDSDKLLLKKNPAFQTVSQDLLEWNLCDHPDLAQSLVVCAVLQNRPFRFHGLGNLRLKETDRLSALVTELHRLGFILREQTDGIEWLGERIKPETQVRINTYGDHRMAMAFAPAAIWANRQQDIQSFGICQPQVVGKSYPDFWEHLQAIGFVLSGHQENPISDFRSTQTDKPSLK